MEPPGPVPALGDLLVLMQGAHRGFRTLHGELRCWNHTQRHYEAFQRQFGEARPRHLSMVSVGDGSDEPTPLETEDRARVWLVRPDRLREELTSGHAGRVTVSTLVHVGATWWSYNPGYGAMTNDGDPSSQHGSRLQRALLDPAELLPWRELEIAGTAVHAGRPVIRVTSRPSPRDTFLPDVRGISGEWPEEYLVDAERGILLRIATFIDGEPFAVAEFTSVAFDEEIAEDLFRFVLPPGEELRNARDGIDSDLGVMPLHEAARAAPFAVYVPASVPDDWHMRVHFIAANERHGWPAGVSIHYVDAMSRVNVNVNEQDAAEGGLPETAPNGDAWRVEWLPHGELRLWEPSDMERGMPRIGVTVIAGTRVQISTADLGLDAIAELAAGLVPAPQVPPAAD